MDDGTGQAARPRTRAGANMGGASAHNRRVVMQGLRINGAMSRAEIARGTGLVPQTVSNIVEELAREGLVEAAAPVRAGRGQPAVPYSIAPGGAYALGLHLDRHRARAVVVDLLGGIVAGTEEALGDGADMGRVTAAEADMGRVTAALARVAGAVAGRPGRLLGLGVAMPAPTGVHAGGLWAGDTLAEALGGALGLPVSLHHDASAAAVAERLTGAARGLDDFVLVFVGFGLGAGLYVGGELRRGTHRLAGELGLVDVPTPGGPVPLESLASLSGLHARLGLAPGDPEGRLDEAVRAGDPAVRAWTEEAGRHLAWAIDMVECLLDPEAVVLAGQMPPALLHGLHAAVLRARPGGRAPRLGSAAPFAVAVGAAADPIARAFDPSLAALVKGQAGG